MTDPNRTLTGATKIDLTRMMVENGVDPEKAERRAKEKELATRCWLRRSLWFFVLSMLIAGVLVYLIVHETLAQRSFPIAIAVILGLVALLPLAASAYCLTQADDEYMKKFLDNLRGFRRLKDGG